MWCWLFGHDRHVDFELTSVSRIVHCTKCPKRWIMNDALQVNMPLDDVMGNEWLRRIMHKDVEALERLRR
jgi:hypothetical protein